MLGLITGFVLGVGCTPVPPAWQRPAGVAGIVVGLISIVFRGPISARTPTSRPVAIVVGAAFIVIGALVLLGVIHLAEHCP